MSFCQPFSLSALKAKSKYFSWKLDCTTFPWALDIFPTMTSPMYGVLDNFSILNEFVALSHPSFLTICPSAPPSPNVIGSPFIKSLWSNLTLNVGKSSFLIILPALFIGSKKPPYVPIPDILYWILLEFILSRPELPSKGNTLKVLYPYIFELYPCISFSGYVRGSVLGNGSGNDWSPVIASINGFPWMFIFSTNISSPGLNGKLVPSTWSAGLQPPMGALSVIVLVIPLDIAVTTPTPLLLLIA